MNKANSISIIVIVLISVCFQGGCLLENKQAKITKELGKKAYAYLESSQLDRLLNDLVKKAIKGKDHDIDKYIYVRNLITNAANRELFEDYDVELLRGLGDARFMKAIKRQDSESQGSVCSSLMRYRWNVDDSETYRMVKKQSEYDYPKTKAYVFDLIKF